MTKLLLVLSLLPLLLLLWMSRVRSGSGGPKDWACEAVAEGLGMLVVRRVAHGACFLLRLCQVRS